MKKVKKVKEQRGNHWLFFFIFVIWLYAAYVWGTELWPIAIPFMLFTAFNGLFGTKYANPIRKRLGLKEVM